MKRRKRRNGRKDKMGTMRRRRNKKKKTRRTGEMNATGTMRRKRNPNDGRNAFF